jgi:Short C-terminal domain
MPRLMRTMARTAVVAGTATAVSNRVSRRQANKWSDQAEAQAYEQQQAAAQQAPPPPPPPAAPSTDDKLTQLKELGSLKEAGVLTEAEFEAQKAKILAG